MGQLKNTRVKMITHWTGSGKVCEKTNRRDTWEEHRQYTGLSRGCLGYPIMGECSQRIPVNANATLCNGCWFREIKDKDMAKRRKEVA